jgi:O-antigen/teichoic acid export membrane protein
MWQMLVSIANLIIISIILSRVLPPALHKPRFNIDVLRRVRQFAAGVLSINLVSTIVTQIDKWLLVALLPLNIYGSYVLATTVANALYMFFVPVFNGFYPRFSVLVMQGGGDPLKKLYCLGTQVMAITVLPAAVTLSLFSREILMLWTRNPEVAAISAPVVTILAFGTALNGLMNIPYALHLAHGWTRLPLGINLIAMMFLVPAILVLTPIYGPVGAAVAWLGFNVIFAGFAVPLTHRRLFSVGEGGRVTTDTLLIAGAVLGVLGAARLVYPPGTQEAAQVLYIIGSYAVSVLVAGLFSAQIRGWMLARLRNIFNHGLTR